MLSKVFITLFSLFVSINDVNAYPDNILFKTYADQYRFCDSFYDKVCRMPDSVIVLPQIRDLQKWANNKGDIKLVYAVQLIYDRYLNENTKAIQGEEDLLKLVKELKDENMPLLRTEALQLLADYYWDNKKYSSALEYDIDASNLVAGFTYHEFPTKANYLSSCGGKYYYFRDFSTAKKYFIEAYNAMPEDQNPGVVSLLNTIALCYVNLENYDSAEYYYNKTFAIAIKRKSDIWPAIISGNLGYLYYLQKKYDSAIPLLEIDIKRCLKAESKNAANSLTLLAEIYLIKNDKKKAMDCVIQAYNIILQGKAWEDFDIRRRIYPTIAKVYAANGDINKAYAYLDSGMVAKDSIARQTNMLILAGVQHKIEANKHIEDVEMFEQQKKKQQLFTNSLIVGVILLALITLLLVNRQRLKYEQEQHRLESEKKYTEAELNNASVQLADFTRSISEKNDLIDKFTAEMHRIRVKNGLENIKEDEDLLQLQQSTILTDGQWQNFQTMFEKVHNGFSERIKKKVQGLSPIETRFVLLSKLKLSKKEMASVLGVSVDAVHLNRERLRVKLNLSNDPHSLENFADNI